MSKRRCRPAVVLLICTSLGWASRANAGDAGSPSDGSQDANVPRAAGSVAKTPLTFYDVVRRRPVAIEAQFAPSGSPIGLLGLAADVSVLPALGLFAGIGVGYGGDPSWVKTQWALGVRPRLPLGESSALTTSLSLSRGDYQRFNLSHCDKNPACGTWYWRNVSWVNVDVGYEYRSESGIVVHVFSGLSQAVYAADTRWVTEEGIFDQQLAIGSPPSRPSLLPYAAVAVGYAL